MKRKATTIMTILFLASIATIAIPVSAQSPTTVYITFEETVDAFWPNGDPVWSDTYTIEIPFIKTGKAYHRDIMWYPPPPGWKPVMPDLETVTGTPVDIPPSGKFRCETSYITLWGPPFLPIVQVFWGELTIDDGTMTGTYFDRGYVICEDPETVQFLFPLAEQIGNSDMWYLGYSEYTVSPPP